MINANKLGITIREAKAEIERQPNAAKLKSLETLKVQLNLLFNGSPSNAINVITDITPSLITEIVRDTKFAAIKAVFTKYPAIKTHFANIQKSLSPSQSSRSLSRSASQQALNCAD